MISKNLLALIAIPLISTVINATDITKLTEEYHNCMEKNLDYNKYKETINSKLETTQIYRNIKKMSIEDSVKFHTNTCKSNSMELFKYKKQLSILSNANNSIDYEEFYILQSSDYIFFYLLPKKGILKI